VCVCVCVCVWIKHCLSSTHDLYKGKNHICQLHVSLSLHNTNHNRAAILIVPFVSSPWQQQGRVQSWLIDEHRMSNIYYKELQQCVLKGQIWGHTNAVNTLSLFSAFIQCFCVCVGVCVKWNEALLTVGAKVINKNDLLYQIRGASRQYTETKRTGWLYKKANALYLTLSKLLCVTCPALLLQTWMKP